MQTTENLGLKLQVAEDFADIEKLNENFEKLDSEVGKVGSKKVTCYGYYTKVDGVKWFLVVANGITGYVSSKYLKK